MSYSENDIEVLSDEEHVRKRIPVYLGNNTITEFTIPLFMDDRIETRTVEFVPAVYKAVNEGIDNAVDELLQNKKKNPIILIDSQPIMGTFTIRDNGRGVPIGLHASGKPTPEVVFGSLRSGRNFSDDREAGVIGMNGMGVSLTQICSSEFKVTIHRDGKEYIQVFKRGKKPRKPYVAECDYYSTGTTIEFELDSTIFPSIVLPKELLQNRAMELALTNPGLTAEYNGEKHHYRSGFKQYLSKVSKNRHMFEHNNGNEKLEFHVLFDAHVGDDEKIYTWVNSSLLFDGGIVNAQFINALQKKTLSHLAKQAKKAGVEITRQDFKKDLMVIGNVKVAAPEYDSQAKTKMTGPDLRDSITAMVDSSWPAFVRTNGEWLSTVLQRAIDRSNKTATKKAQQSQKSQKTIDIKELTDATSTNRYQCRLLITEGESAASMIKEVRDSKTTGSLALTGKINNTHNATVLALTKMGKISGLLRATGLVPGKFADRSSLRYGKIVISTDADHDGSDIFSLLCCLFYQWPELFDPNLPPIIHRLVAPNICLTKGKKRVHFSTKEKYQANKQKYQGWSVEYYKGLGSMEREDWEMILNSEEYMIPIVDDGNMKEAMELLFGDNSDSRKEWLSIED